MIGRSAGWGALTSGCGSAGVIDDAAMGVTSFWTSSGVGPPRGCGGMVAIQCLNSHQVRGLGILSRGLFVKPKKPSVPRSLSCRKRG